MLKLQTIPDNLSVESYCTQESKINLLPATTLVHTKETTVKNSHSGSWREASGEFDSLTYDRIRAAYSDLDFIDGTRREAQLLDCHTLAYFARHKETGEVKIISRKCGLRWCPVCQKSRRALVTHEVSEWLKLFKHPKMLTLTMLHTDQPLSDQVSELYDCFRKLRRRKFFNSKVTGGVWFFQIKKSKTDGLWHPHLHCLITGMFVPREKLSKLWLKITGDSPVCDIRAVKSPDTAVRHTARYAASPADLTNLSRAEITEVISAVHGRRIVGTWGLAKSISLTKASNSEKDSWENVGNWYTVTSMCNADDDAKKILRAWKLSEPLEEGVTMFRLDLLLPSSLDSASRPPPGPYLTNFYN